MVNAMSIKPEGYKLLIFPKLISLPLVMVEKEYIWEIFIFLNPQKNYHQKILYQFLHYSYSLFTTLL